MTISYLKHLSAVITRFDPDRVNRYFLFGSAARGDRFHDLDIAVVGNAVAQKNLSGLKEEFYDSAIPYNVDVVDFDRTAPDFRDYVLGHEPIVWIS